MARRGIFNSIKEADTRESDRQASPGYAMRGPSRNMIASIGELAEKAAKADQVRDGETVVELDPDVIEASFVTDRMEDDDAFDELIAAISARGQDTPVLVRPHPTENGRFQTVFGHRRVRAARELGRKVKAVIREISDNDHVIAQGQENSARENLSFIERALFAQRLLDRGHDRQTIQTALAIDAPMLTRMLSVSSRAPEALVLAVGPCKAIGRDRWIEFAQLVEGHDAQAAAASAVQQEGFSDLSSEERFERVFGALKTLAKPRRGSAAKPLKEKWAASDRAVAAELIDNGRSFSLAFKSKVGAEFGRYVAESLERLYGEYKRNQEGKG